MLFSSVWPLQFLQKRGVVESLTGKQTLYFLQNQQESTPISIGTSALTQELRIRQGNGSDERSSNRTAEQSAYLVPDTVLFDLILEVPGTDTQQLGSLLSMVRDFC
jgi:hypothetical protein